MKVDQEIKLCLRRMKEQAARIKWLRERKKVLEALPDGSFCGEFVDFDYLEHQDIIKVVRNLGGKWSKKLNSVHQGKIDYEQQIAGVTVRCYAGKPPPSCRLIDVEEDVPEQVIPAHKRIVKKMICTDAEPVAVAVSRAVTNQQPTAS